MLQQQSDVLQDCFRTQVPDGICFSKFKACQLKRFKDRCLPPVGATDYDVGCPCPEDFNGNGPIPPTGELAWLVGGNESTQLGSEIPLDGFYDMGIDAETGPNATAGVDLITTGEARIRIYGDALDQPLEYQEGMEGRVVVANGFIENRDIPALFAPLTPLVAPTIPPVTDEDVLPPIVDVYLERPSNAYNLNVPVGFGALITSDYNDPSGLFVPANGSRVVFINNIFLGDRPATAPTVFDSTYTANAVTPTTGLALGVNTFDYLLKIINDEPAIGGTPIAVYFDLGGTTITPPGVPAPPIIPTGSRFVTIHSTLTGSPFIIPAGGAGFFTMRVEEGVTHIMLDNVIYASYTEPVPV